MPTDFPSCASTLSALTSLTCAQLYEGGGIDARMYIGNRADIATCVAGSDGEITALTLTSGKKLYKLMGLPYKNTASSKDGELTSDVRLKTHEVIWNGNIVTAAQKKSVEQYCNSRNLFVIIEKETGGFLVFGLDYNPRTSSFLDNRRGLTAKCDLTIAADINTPNASVITFMAANMYTHPVPFAPASSNATNIATLDALC